MVRVKKGYGMVTKKIIAICIDKDIEVPIKDLYKRQHKKLSTEINSFLIRQLKGVRR